MLPRIEKKIARLRKYVALLETLKPDCSERFLNDPIYEGALLHYLYLVSDGCIALAEMVLKYKDAERAQSYFEAIDLLGEYKIIPADFAYDFAKIASFRNFLAHDYEKIDYTMICETALEKLNDIELYLNYVEVSL